MEPTQRIGMIATIAMVVLSIAGCMIGLVLAALPQASREIPVASVPAAREPEPTQPAPEPPPDPLRVSEGRARVGELDAWVASDAPCPLSLPLPSTEVPRGEPDALGVSAVVVPPAPFPYRRAREPDRLLAAMADAVSEPSLYVLELERRDPVLTSAHGFVGGYVRGRVFVRAPGAEGIACVGEVEASSSDLLRAGGSGQPLQEIEDGFALDVDLELRLRRAAVESLHAAARR